MALFCIIKKTETICRETRLETGDISSQYNVDKILLVYFYWPTSLTLSAFYNMLVKALTEQNRQKNKSDSDSFIGIK